MYRRFGFLFCALIFLAGCSDGLWLGSEKKLDLKGERVPVIRHDTDLVVDKKTSLSQANIPQPVRNTGWYKSCGITSSKVFNLHLETKLEKKPLFSIGSGSDFLIGSSPIMHGNNVVALGADGIIKSYDLAQDKIKWINDDFPTSAKKGFFDILNSSYLSGGLSYSDNVIYATSGAGSIMALDSSNGQAIWAIKLSSPSRATPLKTNKDIIIVQASDNKTFALNSKNGQIIWTHIGISEEISSLRTSAPVANKDTVIIQYSSGEIYCLSIDNGDEIWSESLTSPLETIVTDSHLHTVITSPAIDEKYVYAYGHDGMVGVFNIDTGSTLWKKQLGVDHQFWICGDLIVGITNTSKLIGINKQDGKIRWIQELASIAPNKETIEWTSPVVANSNAIIANSNGEMFFFSLVDGAIINKIAIPNDVYLSPVIANGEMVILSNDGQVNMY